MQVDVLSLATPALTNTQPFEGCSHETLQFSTREQVRAREREREGGEKAGRLNCRFAFYLVFSLTALIDIKKARIHIPGISSAPLLS